MGKRRHGGARSHRRANRQRRIALTAFCVALAVIMLALAGYIVYWYVNQARIRGEGERYADMYTRQTEVVTAEPTPQIAEEPTPVVTTEPTPAPTARPTATPSVTPTAKPTLVATQSPTAASTPTPTAEPTLTPAPTAEPTATSTPQPTAEPMPVVSDEPIPTPNSNTLVIALPTAPPIQPGFEALLAENPETVGFLEIEDMLSLPVVQRENDNDYYLSHGFSGGEAREGALFLDGMNRLVPEDDCLIVYGHNMKNRTMFGQLNAFGELSFLRRHSVLHFDTLYENRSYVAFAAFSASMEPGDRRYFDVRKFVFDEAEFDKFVLKLQSRSLFRVPVDVRYGDRLLLLVTCDYANREGRFILALRQVRPDEAEADAWAQAMQAEAK